MTVPVFNIADYRQKVLGCWLGKNIGGTLGAPFEWKRQINSVSFYTQDLNGEALPNDDLDIQLLWLVALEERGLNIDAHTLADYWCLYVTPHWSEYGTAKINMLVGLPPPLCGIRGNAYKDSCGAFIRSEIWAAITPGNPRRAARYAFEDAILDHGDGEGTYAEIFCAAMESAAFVVSDLRHLVEIGLSYLPAQSGCARAVRSVVEAHDAGQTWVEARDSLLEQFRAGTFLGWDDFISARDREKGFAEGPQGWDAPGNLGILVLALLYGEGDFAKTLCTAVNCGEDTDCTAATAGALFGILYGANAIPAEWIAPIGRGIKAACLNLGELGFYGDQLPANVDILTERVLSLGRQAAHLGKPLRLSEAEPTELSDFNYADLYADKDTLARFARPRCPLYRFDFFDVSVDYGPEGAAIRAGTAKTITLQVFNTYKVQANLRLRWHMPEDWRVRPSGTGLALSLPNNLGQPRELTFVIEAGEISAGVERLAVEIVRDGYPSVMLIPIVLLDGSFEVPVPEENTHSIVRP